MVLLPLFVASISLLPTAWGQDDPFSTVTTLVSLHSSAATPIPLSSIWSGAPSQPTQSLSKTATPGVTPSISGAPAIPTWVFSPDLGFPKGDQIPPTDSPLVKQWIAEVAASGISIPNIPISVDGTCEKDPAKAADPSICWWTCGGCTRDTDITTCPDKMTWGLTYDDGPSPYSGMLLNYLNANNLKTTFFVVGSRAISRPDILQAEYASLHQIADHTWSHPYLTTLSNEQIIAELGWTRKAIKDITGVTPLYMRPPYGDIDDRVRAICKAMNLTPVIWSNLTTNFFDTDDWHIPAGFPAAGVIDKFEQILNNASQLDTGFIVLEHDLWQQQVDVAMDYVLPDAMARGNIKFSNVIECLHKPLEDSYLETNNNSTNPPGNGATTLWLSTSTTASGSKGGTSQTGNAGQASPSSTGGAGFRTASTSLGGAGVLAALALGVVGGAMTVF